MKIYFLSAERAALKLDGEYVGIIDDFERYCDIETDKKVLAEIIPDGNLQPINFFIDGGFFKTPCTFANVYYSRRYKAIYFRKFAGKDPTLKMIAQHAFCGMTVTVYRQGGVFVSCEGKDFKNFPLSDEYADPNFNEVTSRGERLLIIGGLGHVAIVDSGGNMLFCGEAESYSAGDIIEITSPLHSCADGFTQTEFTAGGGALAAVNSRAAERKPQGEALLPFVFFERVLHGGDYYSQLGEELKPKAGSLKKYLGNFVAVTTLECTEENSAGLVYPKNGFFEIMYFALDLEDGKITNIRPTG